MFRLISARLTAFALALSVMSVVAPKPVIADEPQSICDDALGLRLRARHDRWNTKAADWDASILVRALNEAYACRRESAHDPEDWAFATVLTSNILLDLATEFILFSQTDATAGGKELGKLRQRFARDKTEALKMLRGADGLLESITDAQSRGFDLGTFDMSIVRDNRRFIGKATHDVESFAFGRHTIFQIRHAREVARKTAPGGGNTNPDKQIDPSDAATSTPAPDQTPEPDETPPG